MSMEEFSSGPEVKRVWKGRISVLKGSQMDFEEGKSWGKGEDYGLCAPILGKYQSKSGKRGTPST